MPMRRAHTLPNLNADVLAWRRQVLSNVRWMVFGARALQFLQCLATREHTPDQVTVFAALCTRPLVCA